MTVQQLLTSLTYHGRAFHLRYYFVVANTDPLMILWAPGMGCHSDVEYNRTALFDSETPKGMLLTNNHQQEQANHIQMHEFAQYMEESGLMTQDQWWRKWRNFGYWTSQLLVLTARDMVPQKALPGGHFHMAGVDVLVDEELVCHLLEINLNPGPFLRPPNLEIDLVNTMIPLKSGQFCEQDLIQGAKISPENQWELVFASQWGTSWVHPDSNKPPCPPTAKESQQHCTHNYKPLPLCTPLSTERPHAKP
eukprot:TRINITY_DN48281_c0_g1_i1.p1 TRINITY_DN48281_c0_g1~~TRINITY_DN48281_c0_g1_i1.p1  ORF type:complete len:287 (-),score=32.50 TRINITY_DN48281_c0_g1_i1:63-812(-)